MADNRHTAHRRRSSNGAGDDDSTVEQTLQLLDMRARVPGELRTSLKTVVEWFRLRLRRCPHGAFAIAWLDRDQRLIGFRELHPCTGRLPEPDAREVVRSALECNAAVAVFAHNHRAGKFRPLEYDGSVVAELAESLGRLDIKLRDHIVVTAVGPPFSMAAHGLLDRVARRPT